MEKMQKNRTHAWCAALFVLNVLLQFALIFIMIELREKLNVLQYIYQRRYQMLFMGAALIILAILMYAYYYFECPRMFNSVSKVIESFVILDGSLVICYLVGYYGDPNARPFALLALLAVTLLGRREAIFLNTIFSIILLVVDINIVTGDAWEKCACLLISFCSGMTVIFVSHRIKTRLQNILLVFLLMLPIELIIGLMEIIFSKSLQSSLMMLAYGASAAVLSVVLFIVFLPVLETLFSELTVFRLRELTSDDSKLIKKLKQEAPGTYNHSVVVAQLAEACATAVGEDGELARAAAYYHDMGKLKNPEMFTENQVDRNLHKELSPELSADIIRSHARDGALLIKKNRLPEFFSEIAIQHHGTMPIKYFYAKALNMSDGKINISNYSYAGPIPQTKIAAIIMIADASEAACRSLVDRSADSTRKLVKSIIEERIEMGQFDNCDITMHQLSIIAETITSSLTGVYHSRIEYPKLNLTKKN